MSASVATVVNGDWLIDPVGVHLRRTVEYRARTREMATVHVHAVPAMRATGSTLIVIVLIGHLAML